MQYHYRILLQCGHSFVVTLDDPSLPPNFEMPHNSERWSYCPECRRNEVPISFTTEAVPELEDTLRYPIFLQ